MTGSHSPAPSSPAQTNAAQASAAPGGTGVSRTASGRSADARSALPWSGRGSLRPSAALGPAALAPAAPARAMTWRARAVGAATRRAGTLCLPEFFLGALLVGVGLVIPGLPLAMPVTYLAVLALLGLAFLRRPQARLPRAAVRWGLLLLAALLFTAAVSYIMGLSTTEDWLKRLVRVGSVCAAVFALSTGRLDYPSVVRGLCTALLLNVPLFYLGLASNTYGGYLTGLLADKNQAGLYYAVVGLLALTVYRTWRSRVLVSLVFLACLWATGSRTSLAAYGAAMLWLLLAPRVGILFKLLLGWLLIWGVNDVEQNFARIGVFADRTGTDQLRSRIDAASLAKLQDTPWFGRGWGQAFTFLQGGDWFFHNGYWGLRVEGGVVLEWVVVGFTVWIGTRILSTQAGRRRRALTDWHLASPARRAAEKGTSAGPQARFEAELLFRRTLAQALTVVLLVCAWKLGDVFLTAIWAVGLAMGLRTWIAEETGSWVPGRWSPERAPAGTEPTA